MKIMVADNDRDMVDVLSYWLKGHGHEVINAFDGEQAMKRWREALPDLVILDAQVPKIDGFEVCRLMRRETHSMILFLSSLGREEDEIRGLELGADDYVRKPFNLRYLMARIKAVMRRSLTVSESARTSLITVGSVTLDTTRHEVTRNEQKIMLTPIECHILRLLLTHVGQVVPTDVLIERIWGYDTLDDSGILKTHIRHLRQKIEPKPSHPQYIVTIPNVGYTFHCTGM